MTTTFVHVTAGVVDAIGSPPDTTWADGRWWDLRRRDSEALAACGVILGLLALAHRADEWILSETRKQDTDR